MPAQARAAAMGATVLYQCFNAPYHRWAEVFPPLQAGILQVAEEAGARLVALENAYMYGEVPGPMTEDLPYRALEQLPRLNRILALKELGLELEQVSPGETLPDVHLKPLPAVTVAAIRTVVPRVEEVGIYCHHHFTLLGQWLRCRWRRGLIASLSP